MVSKTQGKMCKSLNTPHRILYISLPLILTLYYTYIIYTDCKTSNITPGVLFLDGLKNGGSIQGGYFFTEKFGVYSRGVLFEGGVIRTFTV